jgi:hypothetical protein
MEFLKKTFIFLSLLFLLLNPHSKVSANEPIIGWNNTTALPYQIASHALYKIDNTLYAVGGANTTIVPINISSSISSSGQISSWNSSINSPNIFWHSFTTHGNNAYIIGGATFPISTVTNTVYLGKVNESNEIDTWLPLNSLPKPLALSAVVVFENKMYVSGGFGNGFVMNKEIYAATINTDGTIGAWTDVGDLPNAVEGHAVIATGNHLTVIGGRNIPVGYTNKSYTAEINSDGSVGIWTETSPLPQVLARGGVVQKDDRIFWIGGETQLGSTFFNSNKIYYADINDDGTLGTWTISSVDFPQTMCCGAAEVSGNYIYHSGGHNGSGYVDSVYFTEIFTDAEEPTDLSVPLLKQTAEPWQSNVYDSADKWSPDDSTINRWGCAITSATMVLNFHGLTKLSEETPLDPGTLNTWLNSQPDGYMRNGMVNWLAISRLSKHIKPYNAAFSFDALEYSRIHDNDNEQLDTNLSAHHPVILEEPGHFVVAKGKIDASYTINDPFYDRSTLTDGYNNEYLSLRRYIPSNTDLSYIMLESNPELDITLNNSTGLPIGDAFIQQPINNPVTGNKSGLPIKIIYYPKPATNNYKITISSQDNTTYNFDVYSYDKNGEVKKKSYSGIVNSSSEDNYSVAFDKDDAASSSTEQIVTFTDVYNDSNAVKQMGLLNHVTAVLFEVALKNAENDYEKGKSELAIQRIDLFIGIIRKFPKNDVNNEVLQILLEDLEGLKDYIRNS